MRKGVCRGPVKRTDYWVNLQLSQCLQLYSLQEFVVYSICSPISTEQLKRNWRSGWMIFRYCVPLMEMPAFPFMWLFCYSVVPSSLLHTVIVKCEHTINCFVINLLLGRLNMLSRISERMCYTFPCLRDIKV